MSKRKVQNLKSKTKKTNEIVIFDAVRDNDGKDVKIKKFLIILEKINGHS
ncbi:MAG: hypothetical protein L6Q29_02110 [Candidatus Pacebacteria bacterium]|nr:hypothetical protein [Candidatus Paceibacterota bacterium]NUQ56977.1 hypothetical protein [Candidatus Paceibacter sp.]